MKRLRKEIKEGSTVTQPVSSKGRAHTQALALETAYHRAVPPLRIGLPHFMPVLGALGLGLRQVHMPFCANDGHTFLLKQLCHL
jgi:hypothetical protein